MTSKRMIRCGVVGYGPAFNMGKFHCEQIVKTPGLELLAVCDINPERLEAARSDFPWIKTYNNIDDMLADPRLDLAVIVTPHNTHAPLALKALEAGKHVIVEKPMCITVDEADAMIETAKQAGVMLTVFHNRRLDGDFLAIKEVIDKGLIGKVFHIEVFLGGYGHPGHWWRSDKKVSGGAFYDWGAHVIDWVLNLVKDKIAGVNGYFHKLVWNDVTNEDQVEATIRFRSGAVADIQISNIAIVGKPRWRILGTTGGILDNGSGSFTLYRYFKGLKMRADVQYKKTDWSAFYRNIAAHLLRGEELLVKPEEARRVIAVMQAAEESAKTGRTVPVAHE